MKPILALGLWGLALFGQARVAEGPPVPYLAPDGSIPVDAQGQRVFLDRTTGDAYLLFQPEDHNLVPVELSNHIDPAIRVHTSFDRSSQKWHYVYTLENGTGARQPATLWYFKDLTPRMCAVSTPLDWSFAFPELLTTPPWPRLALSAGRREDGVRPGMHIGGFVITSQLAPGLQDVYAQGLEEHVLAMPGEPDDNLYNQLKKVIGFPYNYREVETLGPRLALTQETLAASYQTELGRCEAEGLCSHGFATAAQRFVSQIGHPGAATPSNQDLSSAAARPFERELVQALSSVSSALRP